MKVFHKFFFQFEIVLLCFFLHSHYSCPSLRKYVLTWLGLWLSIPIDSTYFEWEIRRIEKSIPVHLGGCGRIFSRLLRFGPVSRLQVYDSNHQHSVGSFFTSFTNTFSLFTLFVCLYHSSSTYLINLFHPAYNFFPNLCIHFLFSLSF